MVLPPPELSGPKALLLCKAPCTTHHISWAHPGGSCSGAGSHPQSQGLPATAQNRDHRGSHLSQALWDWDQLSAACWSFTQILPGWGSYTAFHEPHRTGGDAAPPWGPASLAGHSCPPTRADNTERGSEPPVPSWHRTAPATARRDAGRNALHQKFSTTQFKPSPRVLESEVFYLPSSAPGRERLQGRRGTAGYSPMRSG